jgi:RNA polymerase sigma-70 factor (ECF subfamily)
VRSGDRRPALRVLCEAYWGPVHYFLTAIARDPQEADDVTQELFVSMLKPGFFEGYDPERGRFRVWLRGCARNVYLNHLKRQQANKRRPRELVEMDGVGDEQLARLPPDGEAADQIFDRQWALTLTQRALDRLHTQYRDEGAEHVFLQLRGILSGEKTRTHDAERSKALGRSPEALKTERHRAREEMKERLQECLVQEVVATGVSPAAARAEIGELRNALP